LNIIERISQLRVLLESY